MPTFPGRPTFDTPPSFRLGSFMCHLCDLYRPKAIAALGSTFEMADFEFEAFPTFSNVQCHFESTNEYDEPQLEGNTKQTNINTSDKWHFLDTQGVENTWAIQMKSLDHPNYGRVWIIQGNDLTVHGGPGRPALVRWVYAKLTADILLPRNSSVAGLAAATGTFTIL